MVKQESDILQDQNSASFHHNVAASKIKQEVQVKRELDDEEDELVRTESENMDFNNDDGE